MAQSANFLSSLMEIAPCASESDKQSDAPTSAPSSEVASSELSDDDSSPPADGVADADRTRHFQNTSDSASGGSSIPK